MTHFKNLILFTNHYGNLQEMLEMASFLKYVDLYLTSEWGRLYVGHPVYALMCFLERCNRKTRRIWPWCSHVTARYFLCQSAIQV
jgi:hypothetical protein